MGLPNVLQTGRSGMMASKTGIATTGHNIANANTEGYSRQRVDTATSRVFSKTGKNIIGTGVDIDRVHRINDEYIEKQLRNADRDMQSFEEKDLVLRQVEDVFNEMGGDGLNRLMAKFFNEFRKLANDPDSEAVRESVREGALSMINDFKRIRTSVEHIRNHIDNRVEGMLREVNQQADQVRELNIQIQQAELAGGSANDLLDKRDQALRVLSTMMDTSMHRDKTGHISVDVRGVGPLVTGPIVQKFSVDRAPADDQGKADNALDIKSTAAPAGPVTHQIKGGKVGALLEMRDQMLSAVTERLDELAFNISRAVNQVHRKGFTRDGASGVEFFAEPQGKYRAAEFLKLSSHVFDNVDNIAAAAMPGAPGDNRIAQAISGLQEIHFMKEGRVSVDDFYNSIIGDVGVLSSRNKSSLSQQKDIMSQLNKMRERVSGVSIDEETTNLMQYQQAFDASAKVIQVADEMMKTVLDLKR